MEATHITKLIGIPPLNLQLHLSDLNRAYNRAIDFRKQLEEENPGEFSPKPIHPYQSPSLSNNSVPSGNVSPMILHSDNGSLSQGGMLNTVDKLPVRFGYVDIKIFTTEPDDRNSPTCNNSSDKSPRNPHSAEKDSFAGGSSESNLNK